MKNWLFLISLGLILSAGRCDQAEGTEDQAAEGGVQPEVHRADSVAVAPELPKPGSEQQTALDSLKAEKMKQKKKDGN